MPRLLAGQSGFTLLELVVVTVILAIVAGITVQLLTSGVDAYHFISNRKDALQSARLALQRINRDIREVADQDSISIANATFLQFKDIKGNAIEYSFSDGQLTRNGYLLADGIQSFRFRYKKADGTFLATPQDSLSFVWGILIELTVKVDDQSVALKSQIFPRNFY